MYQYYSLYYKRKKKTEGKILDSGVFVSDYKNKQNNSIERCTNLFIT